MIRTLLAAGASALALTLSVPVLAQDEGAAPTAQAEDVPLPTMSFGEWGFDRAAASRRRSSARSPPRGGASRCARR